MKQLVISLLFLATFAWAEEKPPLSAEIQKQIRSAQERTLELLKAAPETVATFSQRGDAKVFLADFAGARKDYEKMITLDARQDDPHWRLGVVYFFVGEYAKGAEQFDKYHRYDDHDRENGVWHYFCLAKAKGVEEARKKMLEYTKFDRHPFPDVYELLAGKITPKQLQERVDALKLEGLKAKQVQFFADLYLGMEAWLRKDNAAAVKHLAAATSNEWGRDYSDQTYMWQVARLLHAEWTKVAEPKPISQ